jgi:hypothetical protein
LSTRQPADARAVCQRDQAGPYDFLPEDRLQIPKEYNKKLIEIDMDEGVDLSDNEFIQDAFAVLRGVDAGKR